MKPYPTAGDDPRPLPPPGAIGYQQGMSSLIDLYAQRVASGEITVDPAQEAVLPEFERIRAELAKPVKKGFFRKAPPPPKGLYLWGVLDAANRC